MARQVGNIWSGYVGQSDYIPPTYFTRPADYNMGEQGVNLGSAMYGSAMGRGNSLAQEQSQQAAQRTMAGMYAYPTLNSALAARGAGNQAMGIMGQGSMARVNEQERQRQQMAQYLLSQLQQHVQGKEADVSSQNYVDELMMQQDLANAGNKTQAGGLGTMLSGIGGFLAGASGGMNQMGGNYGANTQQPANVSGIGGNGGMYTNPYGGQTWG